MIIFISFAKWVRAATTENVSEKFLSCDGFIRSKCVPPPLGSIFFAFQGGKVTITGDTTNIKGGDCEIIIRGNYVCINGCPEKAVEMYCSIHREIEEIQCHPANVVSEVRALSE